MENKKLYEDHLARASNKSGAEFTQYETNKTLVNVKNVIAVKDNEDGGDETRPRNIALFIYIKVN